MVGNYIIAKHGDPESYYLNSKEGAVFSGKTSKAFELALDIIKNGFVDHIVLFNFPINKKEIKYLYILINQMKEVNPAINIEHYASFGEELEQTENISSYIDEEVSNIKQYMTNHPEKFVTEDSMYGVELLQSYHVYDIARDANVEIFRALILFYGEYLGQYLSDGIKAFIMANEPLVEYYERDRDNYVQKKLKQVRTFGLKDNVTLKVVYGENYTNFLAHEIIRNSDTDAIVVLIGMPSQYSDMYKVRTRNVHAGSIAKLLGDGGGKEQVGNFFLTDPHVNMLNGLVNYLNKNM